MFTLLIIIHIIICLSLIFFVLLQSGRGADLGAAFGSMGQVTYARGSMSGIAKLTTTTAVIFMLTSLVLAYISSEKATESVVKDLEAMPTIPIEAPQQQEGIVIPEDTTVTPEQPALPESGPEDASEPTETPSTLLEQTEAPPIETEKPAQ